MFRNTKRKLVLHEPHVLCCFYTSLVFFTQDSLVLAGRNCLKCQYPPLPFSLFTVPPIPLQGEYALWKTAMRAAVVELDGLKANWSAKPAGGWSAG